MKKQTREGGCFFCEGASTALVSMVSMVSWKTQPSSTISTWPHKSTGTALNQQCRIFCLHRDENKLKWDSYFPWQHKSSHVSTQKPHYVYQATEHSVILVCSEQHETELHTKRCHVILRHNHGKNEKDLSAFKQM